MSTGSPLEGWLCGLDAAGLERVLGARPDVRSPEEPRSFRELADRLQRRAPVMSLLSGLDLPRLQVIEALVAAAPVSRGELAELLGAADGPRGRALDATLARLSEHALAWPDGDGVVRLSAPIRQAWDAPLDLAEPLSVLLAGISSDELGGVLLALGVEDPGTRRGRLDALLAHHDDPERVAAVLAHAPPAARRLLERRAHEAQREPAYVTYGGLPADPEPGTEWALERALLIREPHGYGDVRMPAEVALALRGPGWHAPFDPEPPPVIMVPVTVAELEGEAAATATAFAAAAAGVLAACSAAPPQLLRTGGVGVRELARIGKQARCDDMAVRVVLEAAHAAGLLIQGGREVAVSDEYDVWARSEPAEQFTALLQAWRALPMTPGQARDRDGRPVPALVRFTRCQGCVQARSGLLAAAASLPEGRGVQDAAGLGELLRWHRPRADMPGPDSTPFATVIREAEVLGVLARGALSPIGAALHAGDGAALAEACRRALPAATEEARFGADLTAVVSGTASARLTATLNATADREVSGVASVWRFSPDSVRRALDAGSSADDIVDGLAAAAVGALPQPLTYLIQDTARSHGRIRIATAECVIHGEDPALLAELAAHRELRDLRLRQLAPTVLISRKAPKETLSAVRAAGYPPVVESPDGTVRAEGPTIRRTPDPRRSVRMPGKSSAPADAATRTDGASGTRVAALAARLLATARTGAGDEGW